MYIRSSYPTDLPPPIPDSLLATSISLPAIAGHLEIVGPLRIPLDHLVTALPTTHTKLAANKRWQVHSDDLLDPHISPLRLTTFSNTIIHLPTWTTTNHSLMAHRLQTTTRRTMSHSRIFHGKIPPPRKPSASQAPLIIPLVAYAAARGHQRNLCSTHASAAAAFNMSTRNV